LNANWCALLDLHPGNILFVNITMSYQFNMDLLGTLGKLKISDVVVSFRYFLTAQVSKYLILSTSFPSVTQDFKSCQVKLVDFGKAFVLEQQHQIHCSLIFQVSETVLTSH